jgi:hypothetical protein
MGSPKVVMRLDGTVLCSGSEPMVIPGGAAHVRASEIRIPLQFAAPPTVTATVHPTTVPAVAGTVFGVSKITIEELGTETQVVIEATNVQADVPVEGDFVCEYVIIGPSRRRPDPGREGNKELRTATLEPNEVRGAPFPPEPPTKPSPQEWPRTPVPDGPLVGDLRPLSPPMWVEEGGRPEQSIDFDLYTNLNDPTPPINDVGEISVAENGATVMLTGNSFMSFSLDGGSTFTNVNPTTIFPQDDGGFCCDQVVEYVPEFDLFVWLLQYGGSPNRIRIAVQNTDGFRSSNGTAWTYWDFTSGMLGTGTLDYNDMSFGRSNLYWTTQNGDGRVVIRVPLRQMAARGTINFEFTAGTDALWSHVTHNATNAVYWAGHISNSELRVFSMVDGEGFYSWRTVSINSWPNGTNTDLAPDGTDWMSFESWKHYVFGNALVGGDVWFSWLASSNENFAHPHIQMVRINTSSFSLAEQVQIWNPKFAFLDAYLSSNHNGELGLDIAFGGPPYYTSNAVGVWGDFVVYYPRLSTRASTRWGDYNTCRRSGSSPAEWVAGGYVLDTGSAVPHFIRFSR